DIVNEKIYENLEVHISEMSIEEAKAKGAMALFGEKYGNVVRVVDIDGYSVELCGRIYASNTADIDLVKIVSESGIGAGVRRIEAVTSRYAAAVYKEKEERLNEIASNLKVKEIQVVKKVEAVQEDVRALKEENKSLKARSQ